MPLTSLAENLARLVAFPTISSASNLPLLDWVDEVLAPYSASARRFPNADGSKANLLVTIGPEVPGGIVWSGHTDVVPADGQVWSGDPFVLRRADGRLTGRGATDMKGFLSCCLAVAPELASMDLKRPVHFAFSYDEEVGCTGVGSMVDWIAGSGLAPNYALIGEPSGLKLANLHKGGLIGWTHIRGKSGHSSQPDKYVNAVMVGAELVSFISRIRADMKKGPLYEALDPPYSTIQVNQFYGGTHGNIVAEACRFFWEMRVVPGVDDLAILEQIRRFAADELEPSMQAIDADCGISIDVQARIPPLAPNADKSIEADMMRLLGQTTTPLAKAGGTEAGIFQRAGIPAIIVGPGHSAQAHQPDEYVEESQLDGCAAILRKVAATLC